ncbi:acyltransferase family protein [Methylorubrum aminovorans]
MFQTIQAYRGLAAIAVAAFHLSIGLSDARYIGHPVLEWLTWRMDAGVDFFFVLSGFIILLAHESDIGRPERLGRFLSKRLTRIYPIYWVYVGVFCLLVMLGIGSAATIPLNPAQWFTTFALVRVENFLLPISPAWTLIHEIAFYAAFSLLILSRSWGLAAFAVWQIACLTGLRFPGPGERTPFEVYFATYNVDFAIGMLAYVMLSRRILPSAAGWFLSGGGLLAGLVLLQARGDLPTAGPLLYGVAFGAIILGSAIWEQRHPNLNIAGLALLGDASYSIYLTHIAFEGLLMKISIKMLNFIDIPDIILYLGILIATVLGGCLAYLLVERPLLSYMRTSRLPENRGKPPVVRY